MATVAVVAVAAVLVVAAGASPSLDPPPLALPGDVVIGVVAAVHGRVGPTGGCGALSTRAVEQVVAAEWALATINNQSQQDYTIGVRVYDACGDSEAAVRQAVRLLQDTQPPNTPLLGVVALGPSRVAFGTATPLHAFRTPILITDARAAHTITPADNIFTTAPHLTDQLQAVLSGAVRLGGGVQGLSVVSSCVHASQVLQEQASRAGLKILHQLQVDAELSLTKKITQFINSEMGFGGVVILLLSTAELNMFTAEVDDQTLRKTDLRWVLSTLGGEPLARELSHEELKKKFAGSLLVEAHSPVIPGFSQYFAEAILSKTSVVAPLVEQYMETISHCDSEDLEISSSPCVGRKELVQLVQGSSTTATVKAVSSLAAAFRLVQIERCSKGVHCLQALRHDLHQDILRALLKLSYTVGDGSDRIRYTADGRLVNSFTIMHITPQGLREVGTYREDTGVVWSSGEIIKLDREESNRKGKMLRLVAAGTEQKSVIKTALLNHQDYIGRTWAFSVLVVACIGVVTTLYVTVYVALRVCDGTLKGPQVLGAVLLLGLMGVYGSCVVYVLPPSAITCAVREWAPPMCLALCYAILLVKSMYLRALVSVGTEGEVSQVNLHISLLFMLSVQGTLCMLGHAGGLSAGQEPLVKVEPGGARQCGQKYEATLATRVYLLILLLTCLVLAAFNRKIHRNHNEGHWLLLTSCVSAPVVVVWSVMSYMAPPSLEAPTTSVALLILASVVLGLIFIPKMRVIAQQAKEFRHKRLAAAASVSTVFTHMEDGSVAGLPSLHDGLKPLPNGSPQRNQQDTLGSIRSSIASQNSYRIAFSAVYGLPQPSPVNSPHHVVRSPIYDSSKGAYP